MEDNKNIFSTEINGKYKEALTAVLEGLDLFAQVITPLVVDYASSSIWGRKDSWDLRSPVGLIHHQNLLYICSSFNIYCFNLHTHQIEKFSDSDSLDFPRGIDIFNNELYIVDANYLTVMNINTKTIVLKWTINVDFFFQWSMCKNC